MGTPRPLTPCVSVGHDDIPSARSFPDPSDVDFKSDSRVTSESEPSSPIVRQSITSRLSAQYRAELDQFRAERSMDTRGSLKKSIMGPKVESRSMIARLRNEKASPLRMGVAHVLYSHVTEAFIGVTTLINFGLVCVDADMSAVGDGIPLGIQLANVVCLALFTLELLIRFYVERLYIFENPWNIFDMVIVSFGVIGEVLVASASSEDSWQMIRIFRCARLIRIIKALSVVSSLREMRSLVRGLVSCARTLLWCFLLLFFVMTIWATLAVILIHPLMTDIASTGVWDECERCHLSFQSVMAANLTFFQTIVAGDSWGKVAIPLIEHHPLAAIILVGAKFTIDFGVLNLMIAVLVDTAAEARAEDALSKSQDRDRAEHREKRELDMIFKEIDVDANGAVTFDELLEGAQSVPLFSTRLRAMDITDDDLQELFRMIDEDGSGEIDPDEFIQWLYRMKCGDEKTATTFIKHYVSRISKEQAHLSALLDSLFKHHIESTAALRKQLSQYALDNATLRRRSCEFENKIYELESYRDMSLREPMFMSISASATSRDAIVHVGKIEKSHAEIVSPPVCKVSERHGDQFIETEGS